MCPPRLWRRLYPFPVSLAASVTLRFSTLALLALLASGVPLAQTPGFGVFNNRNHPEIDWQVAEQIMSLHGNLIALGAACDAVRVGSMIFVGDRESVV